MSGRWGIPFDQKIYPANVTMIFPVTGRGKHRVPDMKLISAQAMLEEAPEGC